MRRAVYWLHNPLLAQRPLGAAWRVGLVGFSDAVTEVDMRGWAGLNEAQGIPRERNLPQNGEVWQRLLGLSKSRC